MSERLQQWFGLSYASFLTLPRVMIEDMPEVWQDRLADLLEEWDKKWQNCPDIQFTVSGRENGQFVRLPDWVTNYRRPDLEKLRAAQRPPQDRAASEIPGPSDHPDTRRGRDAQTP